MQEERESDDAVEQRLEELRLLVNTAGGDVVGQIVQVRSRPDGATYIGSGKLEAAADLAAQAEAGLLVFDNNLSPAQHRNVEQATGIRTIDRTQLILDIFAGRALSREGQLQVQLAQLRYSLPRLSGRGTELSRLGGGIGTRGPGETKLETDRRRVRTRIRQLEREIDALQRTRSLRRRSRRAGGMATVALVGYTNAGKSTLMNALTAGGALVEDKLFATLDPLIREATCPSGRRFLLADTVGFISRLPHHLVAAFRATLEEVTEADLLIHVVDSAHRSADEQRQAVEQVLAQIGAVDKPVITAWNKIDLAPHWVCGGFDEVSISATAGIGLDGLLERVDEQLSQLFDTRETVVSLPYDAQDLLSELHAGGQVQAVEYETDAIRITVRLDARERARIHALLAGREQTGG